MSIESLLIAAQYLDSQEEVSEDQDIGTLSNNPYCNSPPSSSSSNESSSRKSPTKGRSPTQRGRRSEINRSINREIHNRLEKNRRAQMKEGFERLKKLVPNVRSPKISSLALLKEVTDYVNFLKYEDEALEAQKKNLEIRQMNFLNTLKLLKKQPKINKKKPLKNMSDNESTSTASEGDETETHHKKLKKGRNNQNFHAVQEIKSKLVNEENVSRPSVLVSVKDEPASPIPLETQRESYILYSHLTSPAAPISAANLSTNPIDVLPSYDLKSTSSTVTCCSSKAAAETLLELNNFQNVAENNHDDEEIEEKSAQMSAPITIPQENHFIAANTPSVHGTELTKTVQRKRKLIGEVSSSVIQEPQNKITLISTPKHVVTPPLAKIKNCKDTMLLQDEKAKYVVAFRPCTIKNNTNPVQSNDLKHVAPKVLVNSSKAGSEQIFLISNSQLAAPNSGDFKSKLMVLENELKLVSCKPTMKEETVVKNSNIIMDTSGYRNNALGNRIVENSYTSSFKVNEPKDVDGGNAILQNKSNPRDIILQVPSAALPSFGIVLSPVGSNNGTVSEVKVAPPKSQQDSSTPEEASKTFHNLQPMSITPFDNDYVVKTAPQNHFGLRCNDSKLYFIAVQNSNKTIAMNGTNT